MLAQLLPEEQGLNTVSGFCTMLSASNLYTKKNVVIRTNQNSATLDALKLTLHILH